MLVIDDPGSIPAEAAVLIYASVLILLVHTYLWVALLGIPLHLAPSLVKANHWLTYVASGTGTVLLIEYYLSALRSVPQHPRIYGVFTAAAILVSLSFWYLAARPSGGVIDEDSSTDA